MVARSSSVKRLDLCVRVCVSRLLWRDCAVAVARKLFSLAGGRDGLFLSKMPTYLLVEKAFRDRSFLIGQFLGLEFFIGGKSLVAEGCKNRRCVCA